MFETMVEEVVEEAQEVEDTGSDDKPVDLNDPQALTDDSLDRRVFGEPEPAPIEPEKDPDKKTVFKDHAAAEKGYTDAQKWGNKLQLELNKFKEEQESWQREKEELRSFIESQDTEDTYDDYTFSQTLQQNPVEAFRLAMSQGSATDAISAIAQVEADAKEYAAQAAVARGEEDKEKYAHFSQVARDATATAEQMRAAYLTQVQQAQLQPMQTQMAHNTLNEAARGFRQKYPDSSKYDTAIAGLIQEMPTLLGDGSYQAIQKGFERAYKMAKAEAQGEVDVDKVIEAKVAEAVAALRKGKADNASAAQGEDSTRRSLLEEDNPLSWEQKEEKSFRDSLQGPIGPNKFWNL